MADTTAASAAPTVKFALGTYVAIKVLSSVGDYVMASGKKHLGKRAKKLAKKLAKRHKHFFTKKKVVVLGVGVLALGAAWYYFKLKKAREAAAALAVAPKPAVASIEDTIASAIPQMDITLW